jgi:hypothetical protein
MILLFAFGEGLNFSRFTARDLALFVFFPIGICLGMVVAWRWEGLGGGITVGSLAAFYLLYHLISSWFPPGPYFVIFAAPGFLFLLCWLLTRSTRSPAPATPD